MSLQDSVDQEVPFALEAKAVGKHYESQAVLRDVTLGIKPGERVGLMGPSGSGKSTLLNCLGGIDRPNEGQIWIHGTRIDDLDGNALTQLRRTTIGSIFQFFHLLPTLSAYENVEFPLKLAGWDRSERHKRVANLIQQVGLEARQHALPSQLSGGEMQRVAIARALVSNPVVLLADEPTGNLDSQTGGRILDLIETLAEASETALLLVTHSDEATRICHRTVHMMDGQFSDSR
jgi:ABC-type lipoprotein export system ATPase subunit